MKPKIDEIIVVEGRDDESAVKAAVEAQVIITNGYHIGKATFDILRKAYEGPGLVIFTDPDSAGEAIRRRLAKEFPKAKHGFLIREDAIKGDDVGIENASPESILKALREAAVFKGVDEGSRSKAGSIGATGVAGVEAGGSSGSGPGADGAVGARIGDGPGASDAPAFTQEDLLYFGLLGEADSARRRSQMGKALGIGYANSKTFLGRLNGFGITREEYYLHGNALFSGHRSETD